MEVQGSDTYLPRILDTCAQPFSDILKSPITTGQLSTDAVRTLPRYLNPKTVTKGLL